MVIGELTETYPPMLDGVGRVCWAYCQELEKQGHTAYYIAPEDSEHSRIDGLRTVLYKGLQIPGRSYRFGVPDWSHGFHREISQIPFDILHIHAPFLSARVALELQKKNPRIPIVATFHSKYYDDALKITHSKTISSGIVNLVLSVYNKCDEVWAVNQESSEVLRAYGYRGRTWVTQNGTDLYGIDRGKARETRLRLGIRDGQKVLLFVGQISRKKNIQTILQAARILQREGMDFILLVAGEGPDRGSLEKLAVELEIQERTKFLGFIRDGDQLKNLYALSDLFVFPSVYDNAPMVVREAAVNETPSVLIRGSCSAEGITDGVNGFLCENSAEDLARAVREALPRAEEAGKTARNTIPKPWQEIIQTVIGRYESLIEKREHNK